MPEKKELSLAQQLVDMGWQQAAMNVEPPTDAGPGWKEKNAIFANNFQVFPYAYGLAVEAGLIRRNPNGTVEIDDNFLEKISKIGFFPSMYLQSAWKLLGKDGLIAFATQNHEFLMRAHQMRKERMESGLTQDQFNNTEFNAVLVRLAEALAITGLSAQVIAESFFA